MKKTTATLIFSCVVLFGLGFSVLYGPVLQLQSFLIGRRLFTTMYPSEEIFDRLLFAISLTCCLPIAFGLSRLHQYLLKQDSFNLLHYSLTTFLAWALGLGVRTILLSVIEIPSLEKSAILFGATDVAMDIRTIRYPEWAFVTVLGFSCVIALMLIVASVLPAKKPSAE